MCLLQPQNILLTSARPLGDIRIVDFGLSRRMDNVREVREILGTPEYVGKCLHSQMHLSSLILFDIITYWIIYPAAPEVLSYEPISTATDMW